MSKGLHTAQSELSVGLMLSSSLWRAMRTVREIMLFYSTFTLYITWLAIMLAVGGTSETDSTEIVSWKDRSFF